MHYTRSQTGERGWRGGEPQRESKKTGERPRERVRNIHIQSNIVRKPKGPKRKEFAIKC